MLKRILPFLLFLLPLPAQAELPKQIVHASLHADVASIAPGGEFRLGLLLEPFEEGWHTYWENPGDAGLATSMQWTLPEGFSAGPIDWPPPHRLAEGDLVTYGYKNAVFLPVAITAPASLEAGEYRFTLRADWLVCKEICIPESAELTIPLAVGDGAPLAHERFRAHDADRVVPVSVKNGFRYDGNALVISVPLAQLETSGASDVVFFARPQGAVKYGAPQSFAVKKDTLEIALPRADGVIKDFFSGILTIRDMAGASRSFAVDFAPQAGATSSDAPVTAWLPLIMLLAVLGGLILNLMPCVLPVLSLKALALVKKSAAERAHALRHGIAYTLGILLSFAAFAGVLISLQQAGESVGWGYQMQSPAFVGFLIYLLFLVGLSLSGVFHLPVFFGHARFASEDSVRGSFFTGVLATAVATPCTAPFMAGAVGIALGLPAWQAMLVFLSLGFGLALPFLLISAFPACLKFLPKPGAWMQTFQQFLAFPMYASVIWLLWVLTLQTGAGGMAVAAVGMLLMVAVIWLHSVFVSETRYRLFAFAALATILFLSLPALSRMEIFDMAVPNAHKEHDIDTLSFSPEILQSLRDAGTPVFLDATAAWCITCQLNARIAIHTERSMQAFRDSGTTLMIADWTRRNPDITALLAGFGYQGVPLYVYYPPGGEPVVLPQLLTEDLVINTIKRRD